MNEHWTTWLQAILADGPARGRLVKMVDELFFDLVVLADPELFIEAGAYDATTSIAVKKMLPGCRVVAFEANPFIYDQFAQQIDHAAAGVDYRHEALADGPTELVFEVVKRAFGMAEPHLAAFSSLNQRTDSDLYGVAYDTVEINATTLDAVSAEHAGPIAMWVDVEGAAKQVLGGGQEMLGRCAVMKIEVEDHPYWEGQWLVPDVIGELVRLGLVPLARDTEYEQQYNMLFVSPRLMDKPGFADRFEAFRTELEALANPPA